MRFCIYHQSVGYPWFTLSILYMRFMNARDEANQSVYNLSILYMRFNSEVELEAGSVDRFQFSIWDSNTHQTSQSNTSLKHFQFSIWDSLLCSSANKAPKSPFNSLYEILLIGLKEIQSKILAFNSLYEIPLIWRSGGTNSPSLSILYMRFDAKGWSVYHLPSSTFNSLYEIPWRSSQDPRSYPNFQFSIWDSYDT